MLNWTVLFTILFLWQVCLVTSKKVESAKTISCDTFDPKKIKLVTFDVFAALMDLDSSLLKSVAEIMPGWSSDQVSTVVSKWESGYSSYAGTVFDESVTGPSPFQWMLKTTLDSILKELNLTVTDEEYAALIAAWSKLIPWPGTQGVLEQIYAANFTIGALSNGDKGTLTNAMTVFQPTVKFTYIFSSDFPVGSFKPDEAMYDQVLYGQGYTAEEILHVAGASQDGWGARKAGLYSALLRSRQYPLPPHPCFLLDDITDLPAVLGL
eukprot:gene1238-1313_t